MCRWMESHFQDWSDYNGVANFRIFGISRDSKWEDSRLKCLWNLTISSHWPHYIPPLKTTLIRCVNRKWLGWDRETYIFQKVTKMGSITGPKIDYNEVGALRGQLHIPSKHKPKYPPLPPRANSQWEKKKQRQQYPYRPLPNEVRRIEGSDEITGTCEAKLIGQRERIQAW